MKQREFRNMKYEVRKDGDEPSFLVEGYASTFEPYKLIEIDGEDYNEQIDPKAFDDADLSDVKMLENLRLMFPTLILFELF